MAVTSRLVLPEPQNGDPMNVVPPAFATTWTNVDAAIGPTICTSSTKPSAPYACQWIYQTDINRHAIWDPTSSAWVTILPNDYLLVASSSTANPTSISATSTKYMCTHIDGITFEANVNYKIHVEGTYSYTSTKSSNVSPTQNGKANIHYSLTGAVTTGTAVLASQYVDAWSDIVYNPTTAQSNFTFDGVFNSGTASAPGGSNTLSVGWSFEVGGSFNGNSSSHSVSNSLLYLERV